MLKKLIVSLLIGTSILMLVAIKSNAQILLQSPAYGSFNNNTNEKILIQIPSPNRVDTSHINWEPYEIEDNYDTLNHKFNKTVVTFFDSNIFNNIDSNFYESIYCKGHFEYVNDSTFYIVPNDELNYSTSFGIKIDDLYLINGGNSFLHDTIIGFYFNTIQPVHKLEIATVGEYLDATIPLKVFFNRSISDISIPINELIEVFDNIGNPVDCIYSYNVDSTIITLKQSNLTYGFFDLGENYELRV